MHKEMQDEKTTQNAKTQRVGRNQCIMQPKRLEVRHLVAFRKRYKLTKGRISTILGVNTSTWYRWESGKEIIPLWLFLALKPMAEGLQKLEWIVQDAPTK